jgi:hypothetical protein
MPMRSPADRPIRVLLVAPSLTILGGQAVAAQRLLERLRAVPGLEVGFLPHDPRTNALLRLLQRVKYVRTVATSLAYVTSLIRTIPRYDVVHVFAASYWSVPPRPDSRDPDRQVAGQACGRELPERRGGGPFAALVADGDPDPAPRRRGGHAVRIPGGRVRALRRTRRVDLELRRRGGRAAATAPFAEPRCFCRIATSRHCTTCRACCARSRSSRRGSATRG